MHDGVERHDPGDGIVPEIEVEQVPFPENDSRMGDPGLLRD
jgi:hypothetical protein